MKRIAAFPLMVIATILVAPCGNYARLLSAAERPNSRTQTSQQQSQPEPTTPPSSATFSIGGVVRSAENTPIPGATVRFTNTDTNQVWVSWTDQSGKFELPTLPAGLYRVEASQLGFVSSLLEVHLGARPAPPPMQFVLSVATLAQLAVPAGSEKSANQSNAGGRRGSGNPSTGNAPASNAGSNAPGARARNRGRGQLPPGVLNAMTQGMSTSGFQQTDLANESTGENEKLALPPRRGLLMQQDHLPMRFYCKAPLAWDCPRPAPAARELRAALGPWDRAGSSPMPLGLR